MGRRVIYYCDSCSNVLSDGFINKTHISVNFDEYSGWVKSDELGNWGHVSQTEGIYQFCNPKCLGNHFKSLSKK